MKDYFRSQSIGANKRTRTRGLLLDSAIDVFSEKGIEEASINEITAIAGLSNGTFYNHFKDKDELAAASSEAIALEIAKQLAEHMADLERGVSRLVVASWAFILIAHNAGAWAQVLVAQYQRRASSPYSAFDYMRSDIELAVSQNDLQVAVDEFLLEQVAALMMSALHRMLNADGEVELPYRTCQYILRMLGMTPKQAQREVDKVAEYKLLKDLRRA